MKKTKTLNMLGELLYHVEKTRRAAHLDPDPEPVEDREFEAPAGLVLRCWACGYIQKSRKLKGYPHEGGVLVDDRRWWLYMECPKCGYQTSSRKLGT